MADNVNHSCVDVTNEIINTELQKQGHLNPHYFRVSKFMGDYSAIYTARGDSLADCKLANVRGRLNNDQLRDDQALTSLENVRRILEQEEKHIWDVPFIFQDYAEDNDSEEELDDAEQFAEKQKNGRGFDSAKES